MKRIKRMSIHSTNMDIISFLSGNPGYLVVISGEGRTLTYQRVNDELGKIKQIRCISSHNSTDSFLEV